MHSYLLFLFLCLHFLQYTHPCSLPKCKPGTQHCIVVGSGGADCRGFLGCLKSCPPGSKHIGPLVPSKLVQNILFTQKYEPFKTGNFFVLIKCINFLDQCNGSQVQSPFDVCNTCGCFNGLTTSTCTEMGCSRGTDIYNV